MNVDLVTVAYNSADAIVKLVESATHSDSNVRIHLFLHSQHPATVAACQGMVSRPDISYYPYGCNRGLSKSWNEGILAAYESGADVVLVVNDDVIFSPGDVDKIARKACANRDRYIVSCAGFHRRFERALPSHGYSCFAINPIALEKIGCFDENFFPCFCEDQDYAYRAKLAALEEENCADTQVSHGGSDTLYKSAALIIQNRLTQTRNVLYYVRKWGGQGGNEHFTYPFGNPKLSYRISAENRHNPYGRLYDRTDQYFVRL